MTARSLENRIARLEQGRARPADEMLLIWRQPGETAQSAINKCRHLFGPMDRVGLAQWYGDDEPPRPEWHRDFPRHISDRELDAIDRMIQETVEAAGVDRKTRDTSGRPCSEWSDAELWYHLLRIENHAEPGAGSAMMD